MRLILKRKDLNFFLKGISLGGLIRDVSLKVNKDVLSVKCIDEFSVLFLVSRLNSQNVIDESYDFGINNVQLFQKVVSDLLNKDEVELSFEDDVLSIDNKKISFSILNSEEVSTYFSNDEKLNDLLLKYTNKIDIKIDVLEEIKQYLLVFNPERLRFFIKDNVLFISNLDKEHNRFCLNIMNCELDDVELVTSAKYFNGVLNFIFENRETIDSLKFALIKDFPFYIEANNFQWLLSPM